VSLPPRLLRFVPLAAILAAGCSDSAMEAPPPNLIRDARASFVVTKRVVLHAARLDGDELANLLAGIVDLGDELAVDFDISGKPRINFRQRGAETLHLDLNGVSNWLSNSELGSLGYFDSHGVQNSSVDINVALALIAVSSARALAARFDFHSDGRTGVARTVVFELGRWSEPLTVVDLEFLRF
jgi:hypothetical protein